MPHLEAEWMIEGQRLVNRIQEIRSTIYSDRQPMADLRHCDTGPGRGPERMPKSGWKPFEVRQRWGGLDQVTWFRMTAKLPKSFRGKCVAALLRPCSLPEGSGEEAVERVRWVSDYCRRTAG